MLPFTKKYQPNTLKDIIGQDNAINQINDFIVNFKKQKKKAMFLYGPSGIGKTASVCAAANDTDLELIEINASDYRNKEQILQKVGSAIGQQSLFSKGKIILVDEVDGLAGNKDRGGVPTIISLIEKTTFPIILTAQNPFDNKFSSLRKKSILVEFEPLDYSYISEVLKRICASEAISYQEDVLKSLARRAGGDCRAAIIDLQTLTQSSRNLTKESMEVLTDRSKEESMPSALLKVFKTTDPNIAITAFDSVRETIDEQFLWIDENLPLEYEKDDLSRAYSNVSKADVFKGRIRRWQHWRFLVYVNSLLTAGVAVSKDDKYKKFVKYKPTGRLLKLWWAKQKSMKKKAIAEKIAHKTHSSAKAVLKDIEFFKYIFKKNKEMADSISDYADLDKDEVAWLKK